MYWPRRVGPSLATRSSSDGIPAVPPEPPSSRRRDHCAIRSGVLAALTSAVDLLAARPQALELPAILRPPGRAFHRNQIVQARVPDTNTCDLGFFGSLAQAFVLEARIRIGKQVERAEPRLKRQKRCGAERPHIKRWYRRCIRR